MYILLTKKKINIRTIFSIFLILLTASSCKQSTNTKQDDTASKTFDKNPQEVIRSLYLDESGKPSREIFLRSWGLYPSQIKNEVKSYFTISFASSDIVIKNKHLVSDKNAKILNLNFYITSNNKYNSLNLAEPVWDGRVYVDNNQLIVGGYSSKFNEKPVGIINDKGRFVTNLEDDYALEFPILQIPSNQLIFDPFDWRLINLKPSNGEKIEEQKSSFLPIKLYGTNEKELQNIRFTLETNEKNTSVILYAFIEDYKFEISTCNLTNSKIVNSVNGFRPKLAEGCTQAGNSDIISLTFKGQFSEHIINNEGVLYVDNKKLVKTENIIQKSKLADKEEIMIDGNFDDWHNIQGISDTKGDFVSYLYPNPDTDLLEFKLSNDKKFLYAYTRVVGAHGRTGEKGRYYWYIYIDADSNPKTGYPPTRDDNCYFGVSIGDDCEAQFEFVSDEFIKTFFGFTGIGAEKEVLDGKLELGPSYYAPEDRNGNKRESYKIEYVKRNDQRFITHDYTEGTSEDIIIALSADGSELEMKVELAGFLKDLSGEMLISKGKKIDIAVGAESSSNFYGSDLWGADSSPTIYAYKIK